MCDTGDMMAIPDYSSHFYTLPSTSDIPSIRQELKSDDYQTLNDIVQMVHVEQPENFLVRWLERFGIKKAKAADNEAGALPAMKFSQLRELEFDRTKFDEKAYQAYLEALDKDA
jgi:hypothetical protein